MYWEGGKMHHCQGRRMKRVADCVWGFSSLDMVPLGLFKYNSGNESLLLRKLNWKLNHIQIKLIAELIVIFYLTI